MRKITLTILMAVAMWLTMAPASNADGIRFNVIVGPGRPYYPPPYYVDPYYGGPYYSYYSPSWYYYHGPRYYYGRHYRTYYRWHR